MEIIIRVDLNKAMAHDLAGILYARAQKVSEGIPPTTYEEKSDASYMELLSEMRSYVRKLHEMRDSILEQLGP